MGCGLRKTKPNSEESSPGKIYSTLKRPQVETKVGVAYTYRFLDFLIGRDGGTSTLRLSSVRQLPGQLQELYQQGFVLAAVHPFIYPCGPESNSPQHQLYRAILVRLNDGVERSQPICPSYRLQLEDCLSAEQVPTPELIQGYVKKQIQDAADQGVMFVGFVQEPYGAPCTRIMEPETPSLSLHSSPSSVLGSLSSCSPSDPSSPRNHKTTSAHDKGSCDVTASEGKNGIIGCSGSRTGDGMDEDWDAGSPTSELDCSEDECHNNNRGADTDTKQQPRYRLRRGNGAELLALYNHPPIREGQVKYYTVKVPLQVQNCAEGVKGVEANWLDHMTQHFNNGASLVDGYFNLGSTNDLLPRSVDSIFIFQEGNESESATYDAIVVEQWTIIDGLQVKADYVPLLQSLATYGWRLTCVLPTPVVKTNSDGSLSTKQIVFLQRPVLSRRKRESKKLFFKSRSKSNKSCVKESVKNKKNKAKNESEEFKNDGGKVEDRTRDERMEMMEFKAETETCLEIQTVGVGVIPGEKREAEVESEGEEEEGEETQEVLVNEEAEDTKDESVAETVAIVENDEERKDDGVVKHKMEETDGGEAVESTEGPLE
ncbi:raftlin [Synchiropus picturatus]